MMSVQWCQLVCCHRISIFGCMKKRQLRCCHEYIHITYIQTALRAGRQVGRPLTSLWLSHNHIRSSQCSCAQIWSVLSNLNVPPWHQPQIHRSAQYVVTKMGVPIYGHILMTSGISIYGHKRNKDWQIEIQYLHTVYGHKRDKQWRIQISP